MNVKDFAEKFIKAEEEAFQKGNFELLKELEDTNVVYHMYPLPDLVGHEAHKQSIIISRQYYSDIKQEFEYLTGESNLFAFSYKARYISTGMPNWPPAGKEATNNSLFLVRSKRGKIVEVWSNGHITGINVEAAQNATKK